MSVFHGLQHALTMSWPGSFELSEGHALRTVCMLVGSNASVIALVLIIFLVIDLLHSLEQKLTITIQYQRMMVSTCMLVSVAFL